MHIDNKGIRDGRWRGERKCGDADLDQNWGRVASSSRQKKFWWMWNMSRRTAQRRIRKKMSQFEKFVTEGNEKADEVAEAGAMMDEGFMAEMRAKTVQQEREEVPRSCAAQAFTVW